MLEDILSTLGLAFIVPFLAPLLGLVFVIGFLFTVTSKDRRYKQELGQMPIKDVIYTFNISQHNRWKEHYNTKTERDILDKMVAKGLNSTNLKVGDTAKYIAPRAGNRGIPLNHKQRKQPVLGTVIRVDGDELKISGRCRIHTDSILPEDAPLIPRFELKLSSRVHLFNAKIKSMLPQDIGGLLISVDETGPTAE